MDLLERENLIHRESSGIGCANHIYVMFPDNEKNEKKNDAQTHYSKTNNGAVQKRTTELSENEKRESAKSDISVVQNRTGNNNINNNNAINNDMINICTEKNKKAYGDAKNIFLTDEEHSKLSEMSNFNICLERLSRDLSLTGTEIEDIAPVLERRIKEF